MTNSSEGGRGVRRSVDPDPYDSPAGARPVDTPSGPAPGDTELGGGGLDSHGSERTAALDERRIGDPRYGDGTVTPDTDTAEADNPSTTAPPSSSAPSSAGPSEADITSRTRTSGTWVAVIIATLVLIILLVFILQNLDSITVAFLGFEGTLPLGVALLFAAIAGALLVALAGAARILQLRRRVHRTLHR